MAEGNKVVYSMTDLQRPFERMTEGASKEQGAGSREQEGSMYLPAPGSTLPASLARFKKELIATGVWERPGTDLAMEVTRERMDEWVRKFYEMKAEGIKVPFPYDHSYDSRDNAGFVTELMREGDSLYAILEVPREEDAGLMGTVIQEVSISVNPNFTDGTGRPWGEVIEHVAATTYPVVTGQENFVALARRKDVTTAEAQIEDGALRARTQRTEESESGTQPFDHAQGPEPVEGELRKEEEGAGFGAEGSESRGQRLGTATTDSISNSQHSTSNSQRTETATGQKDSGLGAERSESRGQRLGTATTDSISNSQHSTSNDQVNGGTTATDETATGCKQPAQCAERTRLVAHGEDADSGEVEVIALRKNVEKSAAMEAAEAFEGWMKDRQGAREEEGRKQKAEGRSAGEAGGEQGQPTFNTQHSTSKDQGNGGTGCRQPAAHGERGKVEDREERQLELGFMKDARDNSNAPLKGGSSGGQDGSRAGRKTEETATGCKQPVAHPGQLRLPGMEPEPRESCNTSRDSQSAMLAQEVRRLREAAVEREIKDLLCDGKITPAQVGMARALLRGMGTKERRTSNIQHSTSNDEVNGMNGNEKPVFSKKTGFWPDAEEVDVPEVFREFLAAIPRGAAIELGERTRGTKEGSRQKAEGSNGRMEGHEELARENLEIAGLTHRRDAEDAENG